MKDRKGKTGLMGDDTSGKGEGIGLDEGGQIWWMHFVFMYENRMMMPVEIVLRRGGGGMRENDGEGESDLETL
jgi:hypothetical protein